MLRIGLTPRLSLLPQLCRHLFTALIIAGFAQATYAAETPKVLIGTTLGAIEVELYPDKAPNTVKNFLRYVEEGFYRGTIFHRVIPNFMIQGGGFTTGMEQKTTHASIRSEAKNGLKNKRGTLAMARTQDPHSANAQFYINTADNRSLDYTSLDGIAGAYTVFGRVTSGHAVLLAIESVRTGAKGPFPGDVPATPVVITQVKLVKEKPIIK